MVKIIYDCRACNEKCDKRIKEGIPDNCPLKEIK
jgi:hypothetical protein